MTKAAGLITLGVLCFATWAALGGQAQAVPATKVYLNGVATPVYFNDGDSFRVLSGKYEGVRARLAGFNTLEAHGAVHKWGQMSAREFENIATSGTQHARQGVWHCETDGEQDTYGRMLFWCKDLAKSLIRHGYAHVFSVDEAPGDPELVRAQEEAIQEKLALWSRGVPEAIVTSIHSMGERTKGKYVYNRLISTKDGHTLSWIHDHHYNECDWVCDDGAVEKSQLDEGLKALRQHAKTAAIVKDLDDRDLEILVSDFARRLSLVERLDSEKEASLVSEVLESLRESKGYYSRDPGEHPACMLYVAFERRYGVRRASCL